jgi:hypothetical protein
MTVRVTESGTIVLEGICASEDAEVLLQNLLAYPATSVDWRGCEGAHAAVVQVLIAAKPKLIGPPASAPLKNWVQPFLASICS